MIFTCDMEHRFLDVDYKKYSTCPLCGGFSLPDGWENDSYWKIDPPDWYKEVER